MKRMRKGFFVFILCIFLNRGMRAVPLDEDPIAPGWCLWHLCAVIVVVNEQGRPPDLDRPMLGRVKIVPSGCCSVLLRLMPCRTPGQV